MPAAKIAPSALDIVAAANRAQHTTIDATTKCYTQSWDIFKFIDFNRLWQNDLAREKPVLLEAL